MKVIIKFIMAHIINLIFKLTLYINRIIYKIDVYAPSIDDVEYNSPYIKNHKNIYNNSPINILRIISIRKEISDGYFKIQIDTGRNYIWWYFTKESDMELNYNFINNKLKIKRIK